MALHPLIAHQPAHSPSRKRADHPVVGLSVAVSRITKLHARLHFFSAALFLDGPAKALRGKAHVCRMLATRSHFKISGRKKTTYEGGCKKKPVLVGSLITVLLILLPFPLLLFPVLLLGNQR